MRLFGVAIATFALCTAAGLVRAEEFVLSPQEPESAFSAAAAPDVVGFRIGADGSSAPALVKEYFAGRADPQIGEVVFPVVDKPFVAWLSAEDYTSADREKLRVAFTGPSSNNRAFLVSREMSFADASQPAWDATMSALLQKYGSPTKAFGSRLVYVYANGALLPGKKTYDLTALGQAVDENLDPSDSDGMPPAIKVDECALIDRSVRWTEDWQLFAVASRTQNTQCDGAIVIVYTFPSQNDRLRITTLEFTIVDLKAARSGAQIDDAALAAAEEFQIRNKPSGAAPKL